MPLGIRDFHYLNERGLLFLALSDMKITSRLDSYLTNVSLPWEKKDDTYATVGALLFYRVGLREKDGEWIFTRLWAKNFPVQTNILCWSPSKKQMYLGMDNGHIYAFSITNKEMSLNQDADIKAHSKRVMGIAFDSINNYVMSIAEDGKFKCSDVTTEEPVHEEGFGKGGLKALVHDHQYHRLFIGDGNGAVHIVNYRNYPPSLISSIRSNNGACVRGMCIDTDNKFLFTGDTSGYINCFDLGPIGKERFAKQVSEMSGTSKIRYLCWANENREIFAGNESGKVAVWDSMKGQSIYVHDAHDHAITKMQWFDKSRYLMTASKAKSMTIWEIPRQWIHEEAPDEESKDEEAKFKAKKLKKELEEKQRVELDPSDDEEAKVDTKFNKDDAFQKMEQGFDPLGGGKFKAKEFTPGDDDDLMGWHK